MKDVIKVVERDKNIQGLLVEKVNKAAIIEVAKVLSVINIDNKYR